jgi:tetratricopeptide (TPR) repeat protein
MIGKVLRPLSLVLLVVSGVSLAQTFEINQNNNSSSQPSHKQRRSGAAQEAPAPQQGIGWGAGIEVAREARTAQLALEKGDYRSAEEAAARAANSAPGNTQLWFLLGYSARLAGDYNAAVNAYKRGLQNEPSSIPGMSGLAQTYARMGQPDDAQKILKQILAANPKSVSDLELAGELALSSDPNAALGLLRRADAIQASARTEVMIARAYRELNQPDAARDSLQRALQRAPNDPGVIRAAAAFYRDQKQYDIAISTLQKAVPSKDPQVLPDLAYTYDLAGKKKEAAQAYSQAADNMPKNLGVQLSAAQSQVTIGQFAQAETFLQRARDIDPDNYRLHAIRGAIASANNHDDEAIREYRFALDHMPPAVQEGPLYPISTRLSLYEVYQRTGQAAAADQELATARTAIANVATDQSTRPEYLRVRALIEADGGNLGGAENDFQEALRIDPKNVVTMLNYANLLWKTNRTHDASQLYQRALAVDPTNNAALTAMGYLSRELGQTAAAEQYFTKLAKLYPDDYIPYLALGDLYTAKGQYDLAQQSYETAHKIAPKNPLVVEGGINSALEAHRMPVAKKWVDIALADPSIAQNPPVMRERERYLTWTGKYEESAQLGYQVLPKLPRDPEAPVYLAYDLLFLDRYDDAYKIAKQYRPILPKSRDLPMIEGYYHARHGELQDAVKGFSDSLAIDPSNSTAYMNRGYVYNDLREGSKAEKDFAKALELRPNYGEAHLGLAFSDLQLRRAKPALREAELATRLMGESASTHLAMAEAYRQEMMMRKAELEYRAAIKFAPNDVAAHLALADALYRMHRYADSITALKDTLAIAPGNGLVYANMARSYAQLHDRKDALQAISLAEKNGEDSRVLMADGEALLTLGDRDAAMQRYGRALNAPHSERVEVRLALARLFADSGRANDAAQQVAFGLAEARIGEARAVTPENLIEAAGVLRSIDQFDIAKKYYQRAEADGADPESVDVGLANVYLAQGQTHNAQALLQSVGNNPDHVENYDYLIAMSNVYSQEHNTVQALSDIAQANQIMQSNGSAEQTEMYLADTEGRQINDKLSYVPQASFSPIFEDINIYQMDARIRGINNPAFLPPPRYSYESLIDSRYRIRIPGLPVITGLVEERNQRGTQSFPNQLLIQYRDTFDTIFNGGINPVLNFGDNRIAFNPGLQFTVRRDTAAPQAMSQNLFRQYLYVNTTPFFNWIAVNGDAILERGPFVDANLHSRDASALLEFTVGRPWASTSLVTGYMVRDVLFRPQNLNQPYTDAEYFTTSTYAGIQRKFGSSIRAGFFGEYLRSWRVQGPDYAIAQAIRPAFRLDYLPIASHWAFHADGMWSRGEGFHAYDNLNNSFTVSYTRGLRRSINDGVGDVPVNYPLRISFGFAQQSFYDFSTGNRSQYLPIVRLSLF